MVVAWLGIGLGVVLMVLSGVQLVRWFRVHGRLVETTGVVIPPGQGRRLTPADLEGARRVGPKSFAILFAQRHTLVHTRVHPRAARFRFTTADGKVVESVSTFSSIRPPKPGTEIEIVYDPADPQRSAERADVWRFESFAQPLVFTFGAIVTLAFAMVL